VTDWEPEVTDTLGRVSTVDALVSAIRRRVLSGEVAAGSKLREVELSQEYGVGRYSLRGALRVLTDEGLLRYEQNRGVFVPTISRDDVEDLYRLRTALEVEAARLALRRGATFDKAEEMVRRLEATTGSEPWEEATAADLGFHRAIVEAADSTRILRAFTGMQSELQLVLAQSREHYADPRRIGSEHREIMQALSSGDITTAESALRYHLEVAVQELLTLFEPAT